MSWLTRGLKTLLVLSIFLFLGFGLSIKEKSIVQHQLDAELARLSAHGFIVRVDVQEGGCAPAAPPPEVFVVFCIGRGEVNLNRGRQWPSTISPDEEQKLLDLWVNRYLQQGQHNRAAYGAARLATLMARDRLGARIFEPLAPMPYPRAAVLRSQDPSQSGGGAVALAFLVFILCSFVCRRVFLARGING